MMLKDLERSVKRAIAATLRWLLPEELPPSEKPQKVKLNNVLVIRHDNKLGNLLLITPLLNSLRRALPDARIFLLVSEAYPEIFDNNADLDSLIIIHKKKLLRFPWKAAGLFRTLKGTGFDLAIDASHPHSFSLTSAIITRLTCAPWRLGFERGDSSHYLNLRVRMPSVRMHESEMFLRLLEHIGIRACPGPLRYFVKDTESLWAEQELKRLGLENGEPLIGIFTGGRGKKRIEPAAMEEVARSIDTLGLGRLIFFQGPLEQDRRISSADKGAQSTWIIAPEYSVRRFAAILSRASVLVTPDSGPMHLANALGVPVVAIFREDSAWRYGPRGANDSILIFTGNVDCRAVSDSVSRTLQATSSAHMENSGRGSKTKDH